MKYLFVILSLFMTTLIQSQNYPFRSDTLEVPVQFIPGTEGLAIKYDPVKVKYISDYTSVAAISGIDLVEADLVLQVKNLFKKNKITDTIQLFTRGGEGSLYAPPIFLDTTFKYKGSAQLTHKLNWLDASEQLVRFEEAKSLLITLDYYSDQISCEDKPRFVFKQQWPHYAIALAGLGVVGLGQSYKTRSTDFYGDYERLWGTGLSESGATGLLEKAQKNRNTFRTLTYTGWGIVAVDAVWLLVRWIQHRDRASAYKIFCTKNNLAPGFSLVPDYQLPTGQVNLNLTINF